MKISLPWRIGLLVAGTMLPLIVFAVGVVYQNHLQRREAAHDGVLALVRSIRAVLDAETLRITAGLQVLAQSNALAQDNFDAFRRVANTFVAQFDEGTSLVLGDRAGRILFDNIANRTQAVRTARPDQDEVFRTRQPAYSSFLFSRVSNGMLLTITVPVERDGEVAYSLSINPPLTTFQRILESQTPGPDWTLAIFDRSGINFARLPNPQETIGRQASPTLMSELFRTGEAKIKTWSLEGVPLLTAFTRSQLSGWTVAAGIDEATLIAPLTRNLMITTMVGVVLLLFGLGFAIRLGSGLARAEAMQALLIEELNHRIKNVLMTVQAIAAQTFRGQPGAAEASKAFNDRIAALGRANSLLSAEKWRSADVRDIVDKVFEPFGEGLRARVHVSGEAVALTPQCAMLVSMALHELATNAAKYGALSNNTGEIKIEWRPMESRKGKRLRLAWEENGGPDVNPSSDRKGFGTTLIRRGFAEQIGGAAVVDFAPTGVRCKLECPLE